jgi:hypothetical protein
MPLAPVAVKTPMGQIPVFRIVDGPVDHRTPETKFSERVVLEVEGGLSETGPDPQSGKERWWLIFTSRRSGMGESRGHSPEKS